MMVSAVSLIPLAIWAYLLFGRGWFWLCRERDDSAAAASRAGRTREQDAWPSIVAIIPARDEAETIARSVGSLLRQDYSGRFSVVVVDDQSTDGTAAVALAAAREARGADRLQIVTGTGPPQGWTGKLSAMRQGLAAVEAGAGQAGIRPVHRRRHRVCAARAHSPSRYCARERQRAHLVDGQAALR